MSKNIVNSYRSRFTSCIYKLQPVRPNPRVPGHGHLRVWSDREHAACDRAQTEANASCANACRVLCHCTRGHRNHDLLFG